MTLAQVAEEMFDILPKEVTTHVLNRWHASLTDELNRQFYEQAQQDQRPFDPTSLFNQNLGGH